MAKTKISEFSTTAGNNTDINSINIAEGCAPSGINDAIRELMRQLKEFQTGGAGDSVNSGGDFSVATNKFTVASSSGNTSVAGTLGVTGAATLSSTLAVTGTTTLTGALVANGNATLGDASGDTVTIKGTPTLEVNPTLSGGTANGVLYLNGSKVATSGSALTFDGTNFIVGSSTANGFRLGVVTASAASTLRNGFQVSDYLTTDVNITLNNGVGGIFVGNSQSLVFGYNNTTEAMRLTSTGLGVGTSSPSGIFNIKTSNGQFLVQNGTSSAQMRISAFNNAGNANAALIFEGYTSEYGRFDSSGNLGLGVTPSAWSLGKAFEVGAGGNGLWTVGNANIYLVSNTYYASGAYRYASTNPASAYEQENGVHKWRIAASGTAGDAITFTQALTLDASGNLLLGTTSNGSGVRFKTSGNGQFDNTGSTTSTGLEIDVGANNTTQKAIQVYSSGAGGDRFYVYSNGNVVNTNNSYGALSDVKLKENIVEATPKLAGLMQVKVRNYNLIGDSQKQIGVVAQELETVFPGMIDETPDRDAEGNDLGTTTKSVKYSVFVPMLIKAIQELKAEFDAYKASHP